MSEEIWKLIDGFEGRYEVSNCGRVRSTGYTDKVNHYHPVQFIRFGVNTAGYLSAGFIVNAVRTQVSMHRLVAETFLGKRDSSYCVNHKDGNKANNHLSNLEWATPRENAIHALAMGLNKQIGEAHHASKLTNEQVVEIKKLLMQTPKLSLRQIAEKYGVSSSTILRIKQGRRWKFITLDNETNEEIAA